MSFTKEQIRQKAIKLQQAGASSIKIRQFINLASQDLKTEIDSRNFIQKGRDFNRGLTIGALKGVASTVTGMSSLGERGIKSVGRVLTPKRFEKALGFEKTEQTSAERLIPEEFRTPEGTAEKIGFGAEQVAEFAVPVTKVSKLTSGTKIATKLLSRAGTSGAVASIQEGKVGTGTAIASGAELLFPGLGKIAKPVSKVFSRLFSGLGSSLSGVSSDALKTISKNPKSAIEISKRILKSGQEDVLEKNAKSILNGISQIRKDARATYGKVVESLSKVDIKPSILKKNILSVLEKNGIKISNTGLDLSASEIFDDKVVKRAINLIDDLNNNVNPSGKDLRVFLDKLTSFKFKSALEPSRQAFNNLADDILSGIKKTISESTNKLDKVNAVFSQEMALAEGMESIFGKVKFKNTTELNRVAKKLEGLFSQKGLDPKTVDKFLNRIGVSPESFRTSEAVRSSFTKTTGANTKGLSAAEILQQITSSVVTPTMVKNIAIATGLADNVIQSIIKNTSISARSAIIKSIIESQK